MSSSEQKKSNKSRAHALAAWEWFKEAAWLQVLLIVAVVVGLVVAIPFIVQGIVNAVNANDSNFYESHRVTYKDVQTYIAGNDGNAAGVIGDGTTEYKISESKEGFVVMYYKQNNTDCDNLQSRIETWYNNFNKNYGSKNLKFYSVDCSWYPSDKDKDSDYNRDVSKYNNSYISLEEQQAVVNNVKSVYLSQDKVHQSTSVTEESLNQVLVTGNQGDTLSCPLFVTYTRDKAAKGTFKLEKVIFNMVGSLSNTSDADVAKQMLDVYNFQITTK